MFGSCRLMSGSRRRNTHETNARYLRPMDVAILQWPEEEPKRASLLAVGTPRLLLVNRTALPPVTSDLREDWVRLPSSDRDIQARVAGLTLRCREQPGALVEQTSPLTLDDDGILSAGKTWVSLPPIEASLVRELLGSVGSVVSRAALHSAAWPDRETPPNTLDVHMTRLRRRLTPIEVSIRTVRSRGYILEN